MKDHHKTAIQALEQWQNFLLPSNYKVTHRLNSINDLVTIEDKYKLIILDRDGTCHGYHAKGRASAFEKILRQIAYKSEMSSNSSFEEFQNIGNIFGDLFPVSKLVKLTGGGDSPHLLRIYDGRLKVLEYNQEKDLTIDKTSKFAFGNQLIKEISYNYKKPNPLIIKAIVSANKVKDNSKVLMVDDRYLTGIVCGKLAGVDTVKVKPCKPLSDPKELILLRYLIDSPLGGLMSRIA